MSEVQEVFDVVIAVNEDGDALTLGLDWRGATSHQWARIATDNGVWASDSGFVNLPKEPGLYNCQFRPVWMHGEEFDLRIISAVKVASVADGVANEVTQEVVAGLQRERDEATRLMGAIEQRAIQAEEELERLRHNAEQNREALHEVFVALFGDSVPLDWRAEVERIVQQSRQVDQWRDTFHSSLEKVRAQYLQFRDERDEARDAVQKLWFALFDGRMLGPEEVRAQITAMREALEASRAPGAGGEA